LNGLAQQRRPEPRGQAARPAAARGDVGQPGPYLRPEQQGEEDDRRDLALGDRRHQIVRLGLRESNGLFQHQVLAGPRGGRGDGRLHVRRDRERDAVHGGQQRIDLLISSGPMLRREHGRGPRVTSPDPGELDTFGHSERGRVRDARPVSGSDQAELQRCRCHPTPVRRASRLTTRP
jgi:hypothetical protein